MTRMKGFACGLAVALAATCSACSGPDSRPAVWGFISPEIFQPNCATTSCHGPAAAVSGLDFSTPERGYTSLTSLWVWLVVPDGGAVPPGVPCTTMNGTVTCEQMLRPLVTPYDPEGSTLVNSLRARDLPRMPPDRPLAEADIELIERWILNGACQYGASCGADAATPIPQVDGAADHHGGG
jgi:hypothetical protein